MYVFLYCSQDSHCLAKVWYLLISTSALVKKCAYFYFFIFQKIKILYESKTLPTVL